MAAIAGAILSRRWRERLIAAAVAVLVFGWPAATRLARAGHPQAGLVVLAVALTVGVAVYARVAR